KVWLGVMPKVFCIMVGVMTTSTTTAEVSTQVRILDYAWRFPFLLGGVFGVIGVWLRRWLNETPVFLEMQARRQAAAEMPLRT
ncbi:MFS transporter, partial [Gelidibacter salicanalis]